MDPNATVPQVENVLQQKPIETTAPPPVEPVPGASAYPLPEKNLTPQPGVQAPLDTAAVVDQPPAPVVQNPVPVEPKKSSPIFIIALILILLAIFVLGGYYFWMKYKGSVGSKQSATMIPTATPVLIQTQSPTPNPSVSPSASASASPISTPSASPTASARPSATPGE